MKYSVVITTTLELSLSSYTFFATIYTCMYNGDLIQFIEVGGLVPHPFFRGVIDDVEICKMQDREELVNTWNRQISFRGWWNPCAGGHIGH